MTPERRRRRLRRRHALGAAGLVLVGAVGWFAYADPAYVPALIVVALAVLAGTHLLFAREISRREVVERALHDANRELESFSYSVSHDLRAPLRSIDGFSEALLEDAGPALTPETRSHLERIINAARRMSLLIDDLLALSRVSRAEMKREQVDISDLAAHIVADLRRADPDRGVVVEIAPDLRAVGDGQLIRLALQNLIENAWKFTSRKPRSVIAVGRARDEDGAGAFFVRDDGAGFDPEYTDKLFGPFQRLHAASEFPGTGIGLATVQRIVHRHGGHVWAEGQLQQGACFYFTLGDL
ncbi:MAG TPA: ATP-binding protein [Vicinamibacterales bacterium]|nr:ATP-binding protein [Vicinamibacterales bacterium]